MITGGTGMVGRNLCEHDLAADWKIVAPKRSELDLSDARAVREYMAHLKPDLVIHCAGRVGGIEANIAHPVDFLEENVVIGQSVVIGAYRAGVPGLINLGSTCMYPRAAPNPLTEEQILTGELEPTNEGYALAKIMTMRLCQYIRREAPHLHYKTLIPCNLYGRHDSFDPDRSHMVPSVIRKIHAAKANGLDTVEIWGDGTARREFMFAGDLAEFIWKAVHDLGTLPDLMNVGLGKDHSISDYYSAIAKAVGWTGRFVHDLSKPVGMVRKLCSTARQDAWGWAAPTSLENGLKQTYTYYLTEFLS